jgi:hypothetical protein
MNCGINEYFIQGHWTKQPGSPRHMLEDNTEGNNTGNVRVT